MKYLSKWYVNDRAAHKRYLAKPMRPSSAKPGDVDTESKAVEYAGIIMARRGVDIAALAIAAHAEFNAAFPPKVERSGNRKWTVDDKRAIPASLGYSTHVQWDQCASGWRPRYVEFAFMEFDSYRRRNLKTYCTFYKFELPHWSFQHADEIEAADEEPEPAWAVAA
jgi:hypothetical protein